MGGGLDLDVVVVEYGHRTPRTTDSNHQNLNANEIRECEMKIGGMRKYDDMILMKKILQTIVFRCDVISSCTFF